MSMFHENGVITGLFDSYCLVCDEHFKAQNEIWTHIADYRHIENLASTSYVKEDRIRKVPQGYYCEYCNKLLKTSFNINLHITEGHHRRNKENQWLRQQGDTVIVLNQLTVEDDAWHGLMDGSCALCNSEYLDKEAHKTIATHLLQLIQSNAELHSSGAIYRKSDDTFHCLICNEIFPLICFNGHFEHSDHVKLFYNRCLSLKCLDASINATIALDENIENNDTINIKTTLDLVTSNSKSAAEREGIIYNKDQSKVTDEQRSEIILTTEILQDTQRDSLLKNESEINNNNKDTSEWKVYKCDENSKITDEDSFQIQQTTNTLRESHRESLLKQESGINTTVTKEQKHTHNKETSEKEVNKSNKTYKITDENNFQIQPTTDTLQDAQSLSKNEMEINTIDNKYTSEQKVAYHKNNSVRDVSELKNNDEITNEDNFQTEQTTDIVQETQQGSPFDKESNNNTTINKHVFEKETTNNEDAFEWDVNKSKENYKVTDEGSLPTERETENDTAQELEQGRLSKKEKAKLIATANKIRYKEGLTKAFCSICITHIPSSFKNIKRHVADVTHRNQTEKIPKHISNVMPMNQFIKKINIIELEPRVHLVVINNFYCISFLSYLLMTNHHSYIRCHVCELNFNVGLFDDHRYSETHNYALGNIPVLYSQSSEFVREVQPGYYHCGYCNIFVGTYWGLRDHFKLQSHIKKKSISRKGPQIFSHNKNSML